MIGITLSSEQICNAPADIRRWIEREIPDLNRKPLYYFVHSASRQAGNIDPNHPCPITRPMRSSWAKPNIAWLAIHYLRNSTSSSDNRFLTLL